MIDFIFQHPETAVKFFCKLVLIFAVIFIVISCIFKVTITATLAAEDQTEQATTPPQQINSVCFIAIGHLGQSADDSSINYAFGQEEIAERVKIVAAVEETDATGRCSCELDFPISLRSKNWLVKSGFHAEWGTGKTQISWENAKN